MAPGSPQSLRTLDDLPLVSMAELYSSLYGPDGVKGDLRSHDFSGSGSFAVPYAPLFSSA